MNKFQIQLGVTGISRKEAAQVIAKYFGTNEQYKGTLSYKFVIPNEEGKEWTVQLNKDIVPEKKQEENIVSAENDYKVDIVTSELNIENLEQLQDLINKIEGAGAFINQSCRMKVITTAEYTDLAINNLDKIFESKRELIYKALGIEDGKVEVADNKATFDLFKATLDADKIEAYIKFALALNEQAITQRKASSKKTETDNDKYTFRVWLMRLGMIGNEYKQVRKILLQNLDGNGAFRHGKPEKVEEEGE